MIVYVNSITVTWALRKKHGAFGYIGKSCVLILLCQSRNQGGFFHLYQENPITMTDMVTIFCKKTLK